MREWMKVVLDEVERKKADEEEANAESRRRIEEAKLEQNFTDVDEGPRKDGC